MMRSLPLIIGILSFVLMITPLFTLNGSTKSNRRLMEYNVSNAFLHGRFEDNLHNFVLIYVDDLLVISSCSTSIQHLVAQLKQEFALKALGELDCFLGIEASRDTQGLHLRQSKNILHLSLEEKISTVNNESIEDITGHRQLVGILQYCTLTQPEIAYSVNQLWQHLHSPTVFHCKSAKTVLRYLKGTLDLGLYFCKGSLKLHANCDFDWAGDLRDRRSITRYRVFLHPYLISWCEKKQGVVFCSSTESEHRALAMVAAELYWL
ncbi:uncharacterized protein LOC111385863 [Olea europaea var. sylvestris]|uniref:uncharacterized protein LOC111385863 n=1 Tax=Olea europaea var. sylvestris TaxID=158386 RepID=UPI000C1CE40A|nr:uncharacterized protein LOC111385863 [Olea europaea var. sylvestris]